MLRDSRDSTMQTKSWFTLGVTLFVFACGSSKSQTASTTKEPAEIIGSYVDDYGGTHEVTAESWTMADPTTGTSVYYITQVNNAEQFLVAQGAATNTYYPSMWSQFDWTYDAAAALYFCQVTYKASSEKEAVETTPADANDLAKGCSGFSWSKLTSK
jgi:hypothetical protein